ncbi:hypothetical protein [Cellulomonas composti]|uniref:hypothetical protein n=1 Tax=Cellulomonas composti TaxID=266130 RepID=UPI0011BF9C5C|nr:hypothetical protein [Cellulomonas composti]
MTVAQLVGYWRAELPALDPRLSVSVEQGAAYERMRQRERCWPDPRAFIDLAWSEDERNVVVEHLRTGTLVNQYRGLSPCRFCGCHNGSAELSDGTFCWPEGLAHYLDAHAVRLPEEFVQHALSASLVQPHLPSPEFDHLGQRDRSWPGTELRGLLWTPEPPAEEYGPDVDLDPTWWLMQIGSREIR